MGLEFRSLELPRLTPPCLACLSPVALKQGYSSLNVMPRLGSFSRPPALSVVLPSYRAEALARQSVIRLVNAFENRIHSYEIIVVDDGIGDCETVIGSMTAGPGGTIRVITLPVNRGKGAAVAAGMRAATGAVRVFTDIDLPYGTTPIMLIETLVRTRGFHMVIGDRTFPQSRSA